MPLKFNCNNLCSGNQLHTILTGPVISAAMGLPANLACTLLQQHVNSTLQGQALAPLQVSQPLQVVTQSANNVSQRPVQSQVYHLQSFPLFLYVEINSYLCYRIT